MGNEYAVSIYDGHKKEWTLMGFISWGWCYPSFLPPYLLLRWLAAGWLNAKEFMFALRWCQRVHSWPHASEQVREPQPSHLETLKVSSRCTVKWCMSCRQFEPNSCHCTTTVPDWLASLKTNDRSYTELRLWPWLYPLPFILNYNSMSRHLFYFCALMHSLKCTT